MNLQDAMEYVTSEGLRLQAIGVNRSNVIMSTFLEGGDIARLTVTVDLIPASTIQQQQQQQKDVAKEQPKQMPLDSRYAQGQQR